MNRQRKGILLTLILTVAYVFLKGLALLALSPEFVRRTGAYPYAVLALCFLLLYSKRLEIIQSIKDVSHSDVFIGASLVFIAFILPAPTPALWILGVLLLWLGVFTALFGPASTLPMMITSVYGFALAIPYLLNIIGRSFPLATTKALVSSLAPLIPITGKGQSITFIDATGGSQSYFIDAACSGSGAISIFLSVFMLMLIDRPVPPKKALPLFFFGLAGTLFQNLLRLGVLVFAGYFYGSNALWLMHTWAGYVLFPLWFALFAYIYLKQAKSTFPGRKIKMPLPA